MEALMGRVLVIAAALAGLASAARPGTPLPAPPPAASDAAPPLRLSAQRLDDRIVVRVDDRTFTTYRFGAGQKYPYFYPVNGPLSGVSVTTESSLPWPHHRSLFFGCDKVNGGNYWQEGNEQGQIVSRGPTVVRGGPDRVEIADECEWRRPGTPPVVLDRREIRIEAPSPRLRTIAFRIALVAQVDVRIDRTNHSLFAARVAPELSALAGGVLRNAAGATGEKGTYGGASPWCDVSGTRFGLRVYHDLRPRNRWHRRWLRLRLLPTLQLAGGRSRLPPARGWSSSANSCTPEMRTRRASRLFASGPGARRNRIGPFMRTLAAS
jgi:hypothetical protein